MGAAGTPTPSKLVVGPPDDAGADRDLLALVLNERFSELGADHPIAYLTDAEGA